MNFTWNTRRILRHHTHILANARKCTQMHANAHTHTYTHEYTRTYKKMLWKKRYNLELIDFFFFL